MTPPGGRDALRRRRACTARRRAGRPARRAAPRAGRPRCTSRRWRSPSSRTADAAIAHFGGGGPAGRRLPRRRAARRARRATTSRVPAPHLAARRDLTAPLCDAVLDVRGSAACSSELRARRDAARAAGPLRLAFRHHPLLAAMLRAELTRREPELEPRLHRRAADWHARHGELDDARSRHAVAAGDAARAGRLLWCARARLRGDGRAAMLGAGCGRSGDASSRAHPALALTAAAYHLAEGRRGRAERSPEAAERVADDRPTRPRRRRAARRASARTASRRWRRTPRAPCELAAPGERRGGASRSLLERRRAPARRRPRGGAERLERARAARAGGRPSSRRSCHAQLALLAVETADWDDAERHARDGPRRARGGRRRPMPSRALVLAVYARRRRAPRRGRPGAPRRRRRRAACSPMLERLPPVATSPRRMSWLARAEIRLSDGPSRPRAARARGAHPGARAATPSCSPSGCTTAGSAPTRSPPARPATGRR